MDIFLNAIIFIMGTFFGSFFTLAVYRIPLKKDITHERSFCPNCNHKLGALDLIPIFSYLFLKGKCRYCGEKVRIRYLVLEILSGLVFLLAYQSLHIQNIFWEANKGIDFIAFVFIYVTLVIIAGIDKEYRKINASVLLFGGICQTIYMLYLYIIEDASMYRYIIYFGIFVILFYVNHSLHKKKESYLFQIVLLLAYVVFAMDWKLILPIILLSFGVNLSLHCLNKAKYASIQNMPSGFCICFSTIVCKIMANFIEFYLI